MALLGARASDLDVALDSARAASERLDLFDHFLGLLIRHLAEDDMLSIEPAGDNSGDEELGAVPKSPEVSYCPSSVSNLWDTRHTCLVQR